MKAKRSLNSANACYRGHNGTMAQPGNEGLAKAATDLAAHLLAERFPARRSFPLCDIKAIEDIEVFENRMPIAGHRQHAELFRDLFAGTGDFPSANHVSAGVRRKAAQLCHIGRRQRPADGVTEIFAKLF